MNEEQTMIREMAAGFAAEQLRPNAARWDEEGSLSSDTI